jgi:hypothetical protein
MLNDPGKKVFVPGHFELTIVYAVAQLAEALRYKPKRGRFDSRWGHWNSH